MSRKLRFKDSVRVLPIEPDGIFLISESGIRLLEGDVFRKVVPLIDGDREADEIVAELEGHATAPEIYYVLLKLEQDGFLSPLGAASPAPSTRGFWELWNSSAQDVSAKLAALRCSVESIGEIPVDSLEQALTDLDIVVVSRDRSTLRIVLTPEYLTTELESIDRDARAAGQDWLPVKPTGTEVWIGPLFRAERSGCWRCLAHPLRLNRPAVSYLQEYRREHSVEQLLTPPPTYVPATLSLVGSLVALDVTKWSVDPERSALEKSMRVFDTDRYLTGEHKFRPRPQCSHCGEPPPTIVTPTPWAPQSRKKRFTSDGGHRSRSPAETFKEFEHLVSPLTGVIKELESVGPMEQGIAPVYFGRTGAPGQDRSVRLVKRGLRDGTAGKGKDDITSRNSALCEAIERYSGAFQGHEPSLKTTASQLGDAAIHPHDCLRFSRRQYEMRDEINREVRDSFNWVPRPFLTDEPVDWTALWSLTNKEVKYLPTAYCYYGAPIDDDPFCWADSNGCAAGNNLEEAFLQAFMELVERDCVAIWWYNRLRRPELDLDSISSSHLSRVRERYDAWGRDIWVLDITNDLGVPSFAAVSCRTKGPPENLIFGFGAHFDSRIALSRAVTEVHQGVSALVVDGEDEDPSNVDQAMQEWLRTATRANQPYLAPDPDRSKVSIEQLERSLSDDLLDDVEACVEIARAKGLECLVLDQTRPDVGLSVARVVVPGLRHFWSRLGPGRLYDVPVEMGWLSSPLPESELNPIGIFI